MTMAVGAVLCFFGGTYLASLAAIEAFLRMGGERLWVDVVFVFEQIKLIVKENNKDEEKGGEGTLSEEFKDGAPKDFDVADATAIHHLLRGPLVEQVEKFEKLDVVW